jgi:hypothetical protein
MPIAKCFSSQQLSRVVGAALMAGLVVALLGCNPRKTEVKKQVLASRYQTLPPKENVPPFMKNSVFERCDLGNVDPMVVSGFGLVANLRGTGDTFSGVAVREYIRKQMIIHGFGSKVLGTENMQPEDILKDPKWAIVRVDGLIPPGTKRYQRFDVYVSAMEGNNTTSLAHGTLYSTELKVNGANLQRPGYAIDVWSTAEGPLFVNPAYALNVNPAEPEVRNSLRQGVVMNGGVALMDRPITLRLRAPQLSMARSLQFRLAQAFQDLNVAAAKDEAIVALYVPEKYGSDWQHFAQVVMHTFLDGTPDFALMKARELCEEALKDDAALLDISYCWEALGPTALPFITPLMTHEKPEVAFAAARAAACLSDGTAETVLMNMARDNKHPFQINAVQTLGALPSSPVIKQMLRTLLNGDQALVRLEAYKALAQHEDPAIISRIIGGNKFQLDAVPCEGPTIIYASRTGVPRIAVIGTKPRVNLPVIFMAMDNQFSISSNDERQLLTVYYRGPEVHKPVWFMSSPDAAELIGRLGGSGAPGDPTLNLTYCEVVSLLQTMMDQQRFSGVANGQRQPASFVLQDAPQVQQLIEEAPDIPEPVPQEKLGANVGSWRNEN